MKIHTITIIKENNIFYPYWIEGKQWALMQGKTKIGFKSIKKLQSFYKNRNNVKILL